MSRLVELALANARRDPPPRVLDAAAGGGEALLALADAFWEEPQYTNLPPDERAVAVLARVRGADHDDRGGAAAIARWAAARGVSADGVVAFGDPLAFQDFDVQGELFGVADAAASPPATFAEAPYDVVLADLPRRELTGDERERLRPRFGAVVGNFPGEVPYVERLLGLAAADGVVAVRMRTAIVRREFGRALVDELGRRTRLLALELDGDHVIAVFGLARVGDGAALLRTLGSESAARILAAIEDRAAGRLAAQLDGSVGSTSTPGCDEVWDVPRWLENQIPTMPLVRAADIRNWRVRPSTQVAWPYDDHGERRSPPDDGVITWLSRFRVILERREVFGRGLDERGVRWYEYVEHHADRWGSVPAVVIARSGTRPRVAVLRQPAVVSGNALLLRPAAGVDPCFLAGVLGSSLGAFWMANAFHTHRTEAGPVIELTASGLAQFPLPPESQHVTAAGAAIERAARFLRPLYSAVDGDADRLGARLDSVLEANSRILVDLARLQNELDSAVIAAYGLTDYGIGAELESEEYGDAADAADAADAEADVLLDWLVDRVSDGFSTHELPTSRAVTADDVADWLRRQPLPRAVLSRAGVTALDVLMRGAVPAEPDYCFSPSGLAKLRAWANGEPQSFRIEDYAARPPSIPPMSASRHRRNVWAWRGRYNVPRERFIHLVELSAQRNRAHFGWAGASDVERRRLLEQTDGTDDGGQVDLERLTQLHARLTVGEATTAELADTLFTRGWSARDVRVALLALEHAGRIVQRRGRWRATGGKR